MPIVSLPGGQGSEAWRLYRAQTWNASDAPAMMGCSLHETRTALLRRLHSGVDRVFSDWAQENVIDVGHRFEALGRGLVESMLDDDLSRMTFATTELFGGRPMGASLDGRTLGGLDWEHKRLNAALREAMPAARGTIAGPEVGRKLPLMYRVQVAQQQRCSGAQRTLFSATEWNDAGVCTDDRHCYVDRDEELIQRIELGWVQLSRDLADFDPAAAAPARAVVAATPMTLLVPSVQLQGTVTVVHNLLKLEPDLVAFIEKMPKAPETDQDFADLGRCVTALEKLEGDIKQATAQALAGIDAVNAMKVLADRLGDMARTQRLAAAKIVETRKDMIRAREVSARRTTLAVHAGAAERELGLGPAVLFDPATIDFGAVIRGLKSLDSMRDKLDGALATAKIEVDRRKTRALLNAITIDGAGHPELFRDRPALLLKDPEAVTAIVAGRVQEHVRAQEAERATIRAEEEAKAAAKAKAEQDSQRQESGAQPAGDGGNMAHPSGDAAPSAGSAEGAAVASGTAAPGLTPPASASGPELAAAKAAPVPLGQLCAAVGAGFTITADFCESVLGIEVSRVKVVRFVDQAAVKAALLNRIAEAL